MELIDIAKGQIYYILVNLNLDENWIHDYKMYA
jgi:hypothetical protein